MLARCGIVDFTHPPDIFARKKRFGERLLLFCSVKFHRKVVVRNEKRTISIQDLYACFQAWLLETNETDDRGKRRLWEALQPEPSDWRARSI